MQTIVSIILVNYNTCRITCNCIQAIIQHVKSVNYEIIVVDNQSTDDSAKIIPTISPKVRYILSPSNLGFGRANNLGAKYANGQYIFFLNTDTQLLNDPFPYFIKQIEQESHAGVIGGLLTSPNNELSRSGGTTYSITKYLQIAINSYKYRFTSKHHNYNTEVNPLLKVQEVDYVIGADMFMPRDLFTQIGGFDEHIFMYFEDVELCRRLKNAGYTAWLIQGPQIVHYEGESSSSQFMRLHNTASLMYCMKKSYNPIAFHTFQLLYFLLKFPIIFEGTRQKENWEYLKSIYNYKKYLAD